ncbi:MAG: hypothetical protein IT230_00855 [Flavobacteriales bacterium]|nr:hypothetical protein [Flavobacteriales bacterium]
MERSAIIITPKDKEEEKLIEALVKRMGLKGKKLSGEDLEDAGLAMAIAKADKTKVADRDRVMRKLRN